MRRRSLVRCMAVVIFTAIAAPLGVGPGEREAVRPTAVDELLPTIGATEEPGATTRSADLASEPEAFTCEQHTATETSERSDQMEELRQLQRALAPLSVSTDPDHLLTLALLRSKEDVESSLELMSRALAYDPGNPSILANLGEACLDRPEAPACAARDLERELLRSAGSNGAIWARIAAWRHHRGDWDGALDALRRASVAPAYDGYWIAYNLLFERALAASTDYTYKERIVAAIGLSATVVGREIDVVRICGEEAAESPEWQRACAHFGARMEADADTAIGVGAGLALQRVAHEAAGEAAESALADRRLGELYALIHSSLSPDGQAVLYGDETVLSEYMAELTAHGELGALRYVKKAVARLKAIPGHNPCRD